MSEYRIQRLKEELTYAQQRNKHQKKQLANYKKVHEKDLKEIERLNNIINELEKDFERKIQSCTIEAETTTNDFYCRLHIATLKKLLNKIQELKEVKKSE